MSMREKIKLAVFLLLYKKRLVRTDKCRA